MIILAIDDERECKGADIIVRNYVLGINAIKSINKTNPNDWELWIDHDLGGEKTGYDIINFIEEQNIRPKVVKIISANPVGVERISLALNSMKYVRAIIDNKIVWVFEE